MRQRNEPTDTPGARYGEAWTPVAESKLTGPPRHLDIIHVQDLRDARRVRLPPSYRRFLSVSNGWRSPGINEPGLNPMSKVEWYREHHQKVIETWQTGERRALKKGVRPISDEEYFIYGEGQATTTMRSEYFHSVLWISDGTDEADYLLNRRVILPDGEWEVWKFAHWYPGAMRTRSFRELIEGCLRSLRLVRDR